MTLLKKTDLYATGMAIFAMFFGAGNIIFPLAIGQKALNQTPYAILGLLLTAVVIPFIGLFTMFLYQGRARHFFGRLGQWPGMTLAFLIISLLGPLGSTPRCIALAYSTFQLSFSSISAPVFSGIACLLIFLLAYKKNRLLDILGYVLTPLLLAFLALIILLGFWNVPSSMPLNQDPAFDMFVFGLKEGYNTMDLLAAFFFAPIVIASTQSKVSGLGSDSEKLKFVLKASCIGACLLGAIYIGFSLIASLHAQEMTNIPADQLLAALAFKILGPYAGLIVCLTVVLACLTTAIALIAAFSEFIQKEILQEKMSYLTVLSLSLLLTFGVATCGFQGISKFLAPVLEICYPALIALTAFNLYAGVVRTKSLSKKES